MGWFDGLFGEGANTGFAGQDIRMNAANRNGVPGGGDWSGSPDQSKWVNGLGLFGSSLQDVGANIQGNPDNANHLDRFQKKQQGIDAAKLQSGAMQEILSAGNDPAKIRAALVSYAGLGGDVSNIISAMKAGQPVYSNVAKDSDLYSTDPFSGQRTLVHQGLPQMPKTRTYQEGDQNITEQFNQDGTYTRLGSGPKFAPRAPKAAASGVPTGPGYASPAGRYR